MKDKQRELAEAIVKAIKADLTDRRGLRQEWESIDEEIQQEIIDEWTNLALAEIRKVFA